MLLDQELAFTSIETERESKRPAGKGSIHISFKLGFQVKSAALQGCLLLPLADAISLAGNLLEIPESGIRSKRNLDTLDTGLKDAMVEIGNMVGGSAGTALRSLDIDTVKVKFAGCQGIRAGVRPAMIYGEGTPLIVGRARATLSPFPEFNVILILPDLDPLLAASESQAD